MKSWQLHRAFHSSFSSLGALAILPLRRKADLGRPAICYGILHGFAGFGAALGMFEHSRSQIRETQTTRRPIQQTNAELILKLCLYELSLVFHASAAMCNEVLSSCNDRACRAATRMSKSCKFKSKIYCYNLADGCASTVKSDCGRGAQCDLSKKVAKICAPGLRRSAIVLSPAVPTVGPIKKSPLAWLLRFALRQI